MALRVFTVLEPCSTAQLNETYVAIPCILITPYHIETHLAPKCSGIFGGFTRNRTLRALHKRVTAAALSIGVYKSILEIHCTESNRIAYNGIEPLRISPPPTRCQYISKMALIENERQSLLRFFFISIKASIYYTMICDQFQV